MITTAQPPNRPVRSIHTPARIQGLSLARHRGVKLLQSCTVLRPAGPLYAFWRNLENLPRILNYPLEILPVDGWKSRWLVSAPAGSERVDWSASIINDVPDQLLAWRSNPGATVPNAATVRFRAAADGIGTDVTVQLEYDPPGGKLSVLITQLTGGEPRRRLEEALGRFKALMERK